MNLRSVAACFFIFCFPSFCRAQAPETKNIILVTIDGYRWQEFFHGADPDILREGKYVDTRDIENFLHPEETQRRKLLMPFIWTHVVQEGQLYGNRDLKNKVNCKNHHLLSYPGYSEMLVGFPHRKVSSNKKIVNPHPTVLEAIEQHNSFDNEVAAFATWDAFPYILRESKSDIYVNAGSDLAEGNISRAEKLLNKHQLETSERSDSLTFHYAFEYLKRERPRVTFIGFDETDHHAHGGRYGDYLRAANSIDKMLASLWRWIQSQPDYRDQTTMFITTDHGRGNGKNNWRTHRLLAAGSRHIWFAVIGPDTPAFGEMRMKSKTYQKQVAKTIAAFLGLPYRNQEPVGEVVQTMIALPQDRTVKASAH
ncbi:MAG: phosphoglyceromutase [Chryseosolibacter sp.]